MAILLDALTKSTAASFQHACAGDDRILLVSVTCPYFAEYETVSGVTYGGQPVDHLGLVSLTNALNLYVGYLANPPVGANDVEIDSISSVMLVEAASYTGINQTTPIFRIRTGAGEMVSQVPVHSFCKTGGVTLGIGASNDIETHVSQLFGNQIMVWDEIGNNFRMHGISALGTFDADDVALFNTLTKPADWLLTILGLNPA